LTILHKSQAFFYVKASSLGCLSCWNVAIYRSVDNGGYLPLNDQPFT